jgi:hypothetical protein
LISGAPNYRCHNPTILLAECRLSLLARETKHHGHRDQMEPATDSDASSNVHVHAHE